MTCHEYKCLLFADLYRIYGEAKLSLLLSELLFGESYKYNFWMRTCRFSRDRSFLKFVLFPLAYFFLSRCRFRFGISIPYRTEIGGGFYIGHSGCIVVHWKSTIGKNCNISQGVTLGKANRGRNEGVPTLGDCVYIGPGAKIVGSVRIGNNVAIGANCVVTKDVPDNAVVVGIPGKVISFEGSKGYVGKTDYQTRVRASVHGSRAV